MRNIDIKVLLERTQQELIDRMSFKLIRGSALIRNSTADVITGRRPEELVKQLETDVQLANVHCLMYRGDSSRLVHFLLGFRSAVKDFGVQKTKIAVAPLTNGIGFFSREQLDTIEQTLREDVMDHGHWMIGYNCGVEYEGVVMMQALFQGEKTDG